MDLYHLRQGLHVIASSWDYHGGAASRVSVRGNSGRFNSPGYKAIWYAPTQYIQPHTSTPLLVMSRTGECSRLVMENPLPPHLGTRLTGPMPDKCLVHSKA
jgi:hypothetical protein